MSFIELLSLIVITYIIVGIILLLFGERLQKQPYPKK